MKEKNESQHFFSSSTNLQFQIEKAYIGHTWAPKVLYGAMHGTG